LALIPTVSQREREPDCSLSLEETDCALYLWERAGMRASMRTHFIEK